MFNYFKYTLEQRDKLKTTQKKRTLPFEGLLQIKNELPVYRTHYTVYFKQNNSEKKRKNEKRKWIKMMQVYPKVGKRVYLFTTKKATDKNVSRKLSFKKERILSTFLSVFYSKLKYQIFQLSIHFLLFYVIYKEWLDHSNSLTSCIHSKE